MSLKSTAWKKSLNLAWRKESLSYYDFFPSRFFIKTSSTGLDSSSKLTWYSPLWATVPLMKDKTSYPTEDLPGPCLHSSSSFIVKIVGPINTFNLSSYKITKTPFELESSTLFFLKSSLLLNKFRTYYCIHVPWFFSCHSGWISANWDWF